MKGFPLELLLSRKTLFIASAGLLLINGIGLVYANNESKSNNIGYNEMLVTQLWKDYYVKYPQKVAILSLSSSCYLLSLTHTFVHR